MDLSKVKKTLEKRYDKRQEELESRRLALLQKIKNGINDFFYKFPSVSKIVVFGSLTRTGYFTEFSDVDVAVQDLPNTAYWQAIAWFEKCLETEKIDLVRIEDANPRILKHIKRGEIIYEKEIRDSENIKIRNS